MGPAVRTRVDSLDHAAYRNQHWFPALDGVRAVSIALVFSDHVGYEPFWRQFYGGNGVNVFFVLSGFLISTLLLREEAGDGRVSLRSFYLRRLFRIYPTYFAVLAAYCLLVLKLGFAPERHDVFRAQLPYYVFGFPEHDFFRPGLGNGAAPFAGAWSIGIEEKFYLVWPAVGFVLLRGNRTARLVVCIVSGLFFAVAPQLWSGGEYLFHYLFINLGVILAVLLHDPDTFRRLRVLAKPRVLTGMFVTFAAAQLVLAHVADDFLVTLDGLLIAGTLGGIVLSTGRVTAWLRHPWMVRLGVWSYVFYLTHNFVLNAVEKTPLGRSSFLWSVGDVLVAFPLAAALAALIHRWYEKPLNQVGRRLAHRERKPFHAV